LDRAPDYGSGG